LVRGVVPVCFVLVLAAFIAVIEIEIAKKECNKFLNNLVMINLRLFINPIAYAYGLLSLYLQHSLLKLKPKKFKLTMSLQALYLVSKGVFIGKTGYFENRFFKLYYFMVLRKLKNLETCFDFR
jgi:hypothetical protein